MYSEEETELRDVIMQNLENCGLLNKIKAELRAGVFLALEEDGNFKSKIPLFNPKFDEFINTSEGKLTVSLVRDFLEYYSLNFTLSVFEPEVSSSFISRSELCDQFKMNKNNGPLLLELLKDALKSRNENSMNKSLDELNFSQKAEKSNLSEKMSDTTFVLEDINFENTDQIKKITHSDSGNDSLIKSPKVDLKDSTKDCFSTTDILSLKKGRTKNVSEKTLTSIFEEKSDSSEKDDNSIFKEAANVPDDPFFDDPLPSEKPSIYTFPESSAKKSENVLSSKNQGDLNESKKSSLTSLKDLPSLAANEWTFSRNDKNTLPSLDSLKSISSSEASNEEIINLDQKETFRKKDSVNAESNEESSEKQNSDSIEEEIEEDSSANLDELYNSLSLADDETTDHTVSQVSTVEGVDHVEPCK